MHVWRTTAQNTYLTSTTTNWRKLFYNQLGNWLHVRIYWWNADKLILSLSLFLSRMANLIEPEIVDKYTMRSAHFVAIFHDNKKSDLSAVFLCVIHFGSEKIITFWTVIGWKDCSVELNFVQRNRCNNKKNIKCSTADDHKFGTRGVSMIYSVYYGRVSNGIWPYSILYS